MTGWLLTWLWQGLALAILTAAAFRVLPRINAATRYAIWWAVFFSLIWLGWASSPNTARAAAANLPAGAFEFTPALVEIPALPEAAVTSLVMLWMSVALFKMLRVLPGLHALYRLKDSCGPILSSIEEQLPLWREVKRSGRRVELMICDRLPNAAVLGLHQPFIAFPPRLLRLVSREELDQILLHEYGHVQRGDDWTRLLQALFEAALWMHPATYVIVRHLNLEREVACDDWVVARTRRARAYAACLARVIEAHHTRLDSAIVPALFRGTPDVLSRVDRLLNANRNATRRVSIAAAAMGAAIILILATHLHSIPLIGELGALDTPDVRRPVTWSIAGAVLPQAPLLDAPAPAPAGPRPLVPRIVTRQQTASVEADARVADTIALAEEAPVLTDISARSISPLSLVPGPLSPNGAQRPDQGLRTKDQGLRTKDQGPSKDQGLFTNVGRATRKASVALAGSLSKASVSLASSFQPQRR